MRSHSSLLAILLLGAALAGCASDDDGDATNGDPTPSTGSTPGTSTPPSPTPSQPTSPTKLIPTPVANATQPPASPTGNVSRVVVLSAPDRATPGARAEVCFRVEGSGTIPHVAVHWDDQSHPGASSFTEYDGGAAYPGGGPTSPLASLPGTFCANLTAPSSGRLFYRAHALDPPRMPGVLSEEHVLDVGAPSGVHFVGDVPEVAPANATVTVCWAAAGASGTVPHVAVHWDDESHPNATAFSAYDGGAAYPENATTASAGGYDLANTFCTNLRAPASGALYYRAHVMGGANFTSPGALSAERVLVVAPRVNVVGPVPATAPANSDVQLCWRAEGSGTITHTAIHWDTESHPGNATFTAYDGGALYANNGNASAAAQTLPGPWCARLTMPASGAVYFRAHAVYATLPGEVGAEHVIRVA